MLHYQEVIRDLVPPWNFIFKPTKLIHSNNGVTFLIVPENHKDFFGSIEALSRIYPVAKKLYPATTSLLITYGSEYQYVEDGKLEIIDVKVNK